MPGLGIYIQVPFCQTRCTYCNFHTGVVSSTRFVPYIEAVCREIRGYRQFLANAGVAIEADLPGAIVDTAYIGGGTPSLLDPRLLRDLIASVRAEFTSDLREVTLEADPETVTLEKA